MRSIRKRAYALAITFAILFANLTQGSDNTAVANSAAGHRPHRADRRRGGDKKSSRRASRRGGDKKSSSRASRRSGGGRERSSDRRRGRHARSRRSRQSVVQDAPVSGRQIATGIPAERVTEIQKALIKLGYLSGQPSGQYDDDTVEAMKQFQSASQLPATGLPSAHALKRLGVSKRSADGYAVPVKSSSGQSDGL